ncbi:MAG: electron transfer flavoprotein subunit beta/FixA family protein [Treponema sp.]|nr:electron transfer flavoprotein subunit beta/FixA family protein [Treponema sp.]
MNIIVLVKQVPDTQHVTGDAMTPEGTVNRAALPAIFNPDDLFALEAALQIKDSKPNSTVQVLCMGPQSTAAVLKECLYRGADFTALISDRGFAGADTLATSYALSCAIKKIGAYDLVLCGRQAIDGDTAQVGPQTAEKLGINQITCVSKIEKLDKKEIVAIRSIEGGWEKVKTSLPVLLTFTAEGEMPRPPSAIKTMTYKRAVPVSGEAGSPGDPFGETAGNGNPMALWDIPAINADPIQCGLSGSPTKVKKIDSVVLTAADIQYIEPDEAGINELIHGLIADHTFG